MTKRMTGRANLEDGGDDEPSIEGYGVCEVDAELDTCDFEKAEYI